MGMGLLRRRLDATKRYENALQEIDAPDWLSGTALPSVPSETLEQDAVTFQLAHFMDRTEFRVEISRALRPSG